MFLGHKKTLKKTRIKLYNTLALPVLLYGSETWTVKAGDARRITAAEMKYMRFFNLLTLITYEYYHYKIHHNRISVGNGILLHAYENISLLRFGKLHPNILRGVDNLLGPNIFVPSLWFKSPLPPVCVRPLTL